MANAFQADSATLLQSMIRRYLVDDNTVAEHVGFVLDTITYHRLLQDVQPEGVSSAAHQQQRIWVARLRSLLESQNQSARWAGVSFVRITAQQSHGLFTEHVRTWVTLLVGLLTKTDSVSTLQAIMVTLTELFAKTSKRPDLRSDVASKYLPDFHNNLLQLSTNRPELWSSIFDSLTASVTLFPTTFRLAVDRTEALAVSCLDGRQEKNEGLVSSAATCFAALHLAGGKNPNHPTERIGTSEQWRLNVQEVIKALHRTLNRLFETVEEDEGSKMAEEDLVARNKYFVNMPKPAADAVVRYPYLVARFASLVKTLIACLTCQTKEEVRLPLNSLIALLSRVYSVSNQTPMSEARGVDREDFLILISGLPTLHLVANQVLMTLLASTRDHLVRHMSLINSIAIKLLRHSSNSNGGGQNARLRLSVYGVIEQCIETFGIPFLTLIQVQLMNALLQDLRMPAARIVNALDFSGSGNASLNPNSRANNHSNVAKQKGGAGGKNARRGHSNLTLSAVNPLDEMTSPVVFSSALVLLASVLKTGGPGLPAHGRAKADTLVVSHLLNSQHHVNPIESALTPGVFYSATVRDKLYQCLLSSIVSPGDTQSSLVPLSMGIFKAGLSDTEKHVRETCNGALIILDLILHSRMPPMQRARSAAKTTGGKDGEKGQPVQDASESLFGSFGVSSGKGQSTVDEEQDDDERMESEGEDEKDESEDEEDSNTMQIDSEASSPVKITTVEESESSSKYVQLAKIAKSPQLSAKVVVNNNSNNRGPPPFDLLSPKLVGRKSLSNSFGSSTTTTTTTTTTTKATTDTISTPSNATVETNVSTTKTLLSSSLSASTLPAATANVSSTTVAMSRTTVGSDDDDDDEEIPDIDMGGSDDDEEDEDSD